MRHARRVAMKLQRVPTSLKLRGAGLSAYDIVHAHDFRSALALSEVEGLAGVKVATIRDYAPICGTTHNILADGSRCHCTWHDVVRTKRFQEVGFPRNYARAFQYWHNVPYRQEAFSKIKHQIFISHAQKEEIGEQMDLAGVHASVIYNPVGAEYFQPLMHSIKEGRVLYAGRVEDYKGVGLLLEAWEKIAEEFPQAHLRIIGEGAQIEDYKRWVAGHGLQEKVVFAGRVPHERLRDEYDQAEIVVSPHIWTEPFGRTVAEAMAQGKAVVAANSGGPGEIIQDGWTGFLFEKSNVLALVERMNFVLNLLNVHHAKISALGFNARAWAQENLTPENIAQQYEDFYEKMLSRT